MHGKTVRVVDSQGQPLANTHPARARALLRRQRARVISRDPFVIALCAPHGAARRAEQAQ